MSSPYTNYPDIVTSAGIPLIGSGNIPVTNGKYWFVDSVNGADANNGSNTATPFKTITQAVAVALTNDVILVMPGTYTEAVTVSVAGIHIIGISTTTHPVSWTSATDTVTCAITAANVEVAGIYFKPPTFTAGSPASITLSNAAYAYIHNNRFQGQTGSYDCILSPVCNSDNVIIANNDFEYMNTASHGAAIRGIDAGTSEYSDWKILGNKFSSCVLAVSLAGRVCLVQGNHFAQEGVNASGTIASVTTTKLSLFGTTGSGTGANLVHGNYFGGTYSAAGGYIVGSTVDDWSGNFVIAGITTANPA